MQTLRLRQTIKHRVLLQTPTKPHLFVGQVVHHAATCVACVQTQVETPRHLASTLDDSLHETSRALSRVNFSLAERCLNEPVAQAMPLARAVCQSDAVLLIELEELH